MATQKKPTAHRSILTPPSWLPKPVVAFTRECEQSQSILGRSIWQGEELRQRLLRLVTRNEMHSVWRQLSKQPFRQDVSPGPEARDVFLRSYLLAAVYPGQPEPFWKSFPTKRKQQQTLGQIAEHATALLDALGPHDAFDQHTAWDILDQALSAIAQGPGSESDTNKSKSLEARQKRSFHEILAELGEVTRGRFWSGFGPDGPLSFPISSGALFALLPDTLRAVTELAKLAGEMPLTKPPKKTKTAYRTVYIRHIASCIRAHFDTPFHEVVAKTTNVAFDLTDKDHVTESLVRRLTKVR